MHRKHLCCIQQWGHILSSWIFIHHHKSYSYNVTWLFWHKLSLFYLTAVGVSIIFLGSAMPLKNPAKVTKEILLLSNPKRVGVPWWFPNFFFKNSIFKTALIYKKHVIFRICSLPKDKPFLKICFSNIHWLNCLWSFKTTYRSKSKN